MSYGSAPASVALRRALRWVFPDPCLACGVAEAASDEPAIGLCVACRRLLVPAPTTCCTGCGRPLDGMVDEPARCGGCRRRPPAWDALAWGWRYAAPLDATFAGLKFGRLDYLGPRLGRAAVDLTGRRLRGPGVDVARCDAVVAVPLHWRRRWGRGYDQAALIADGVAAELGLPRWSLLARHRATPPQSLASTAADRRRLRGAFACRETGRARGRRLLLVDDVTTTGATLDAAARVLVAAGARVVALAVARTPAADEHPVGGGNEPRELPLASRASRS